MTAFVQEQEGVKLLLRPPAPYIVMRESQIAYSFHMFYMNQPSDSTTVSHLLKLFISFHEPEGMTNCHNLFFLLTRPIALAAILIAVFLILSRFVSQLWKFREKVVDGLEE